MKNSIAKFKLATLFVTLVCAASSVRAGPPAECALFQDDFEFPTWYVDAAAPPGGNGQSWPTAFNDLQAALGVAGAGHQIWVAKGTYLPVTPADTGNISISEKQATFELVSGSAMVGGFETDACGGGTRGSEPSILSGDLAGNDADGNADGITDTGLEDNSHNVVTANDPVPGTLLDGFWIVGGVSEGSSFRSGAGLLLRGGDLSAANLYFAGNHSSLFGNGGALGIEQGNLQISESLFEANTANGNGGALGLVGPGSLDLRQVDFVNNRGKGGGGAAYWTGDVAGRLFDVTFEDNEVSTDGGGNGNGGGLYIDGGAATLAHVEFLSNSATQIGGGMHVRTGQVSVTHSVYYGNQADNAGGALSVTGFSDGLTLAYTVLTQNSAANGGGVYAGGPFRMSHTTVADNTATSSGGGIYVLGNTTSAVNSIIWANTASSLAGVRAINNTSFSRSVVQGSGGSPWLVFQSSAGLDGGGVLDTDPLFVAMADPMGPDGLFGTQDDGLALMEGSPALNQAVHADLGDFDQDGNRREGLTDAGDRDDDGDVEEALALDFSGNPGLSNHRRDLGAYELVYEGVVTPAILYVDGAAAPGGDGTSWGSAFDQLTDALAAADGNDEVWVAAGTYVPGNDPADTFALPAQVGVFGGFAGTETQRDQRNADPLSNNTIISGEIQTAAVSDNAVHVVTAGGTGPQTLLDGFTVTRGYDNPGGGGGFGGGILNYGGAATFQNLHVIDNYAGSGGGVANRGFAQPRFSGCVFEDNSAVSGGAIYSDGSQVTIVNCHFEANEASNGGGAVTNTFRSSMKLSHTSFFNNIATASISAPGPGGGGLLNTDNSELSAQQLVFAGNVAVHGGGYASFNSSNSVLSHITFFDNSAVLGGALSGWNGSEVSLVNSIFWDNKLDTTIRPGNEVAEEIYLSSSGSQGGILNLANSIVDGGLVGSHIFTCGNCDVVDDGNNASDDPLFIDEADPDGPDNLIRTLDDGLALQSTSPAIGAGIFVDFYDLDGDGDKDELQPDLTDIDEDDNVDEPVPTDIAGRDRNVPPETDLGAYEYDL